MSARSRRRNWIWGLSVALVVAVALTGAALIGAIPRNPAASAPAARPADQPAGESEAMPVKVIHPKQDVSLQVTVRQLATVESFFHSEQYAKVSGVVRSVPKGINDPVRAGDLLVDIDVPDLDLDVAQKQVVIAQRMNEKRVAEAKLQLAQAEYDVAVAMAKQRRAEVGQAVAALDARKKQFARLQAMAKRDAIQPERVEEGERDMLSAKSAADAANAAVEKAEADAKEKSAGIAAAQADVELKATLINVAREDYQRTVAEASFARLRAPFDGVILRRHVDPGSFVQNATTGTSRPLIVVARTDIVTVAADFPDNAAPFIKVGIPATIEFEDLPELTIAAHVTRLSPSIRNSDRTMRVEVDLYNGSPTEHSGFCAATLATGLTPLCAGCPLAGAALHAIANDRLDGQRKSARDPAPQPAFAAGRSDAARLLPGMIGTMRLELSRPSSSSVIPSTAVYTLGGKPYLLLVKDGQTKQTPIRVHVNDGTLAKVSVITRLHDAGGSREVLRELGPDEEIVAARQIEVGPGQRVATVLEDW